MDKLKLANILAEAMVQEVKEREIIKDVINCSDDLDGLMKGVTSLFGLMLCPLVIEWLENDEDVKKYITGKEQESINVYKGIFGKLKE